MKCCYIKSLFSLIMLLFIVACGDPSAQSAHPAVKIGPQDECHLCGMIIVNFPGPKGEAYTKTSTKVKKFCSTLDLFSFLLDPEYQYQIKEVYVHDMGKTPWEAPQDSDFIDARTAWYVVGSSKLGSMGKTLASFAMKKDADRFMKKNGGKVYTYDDINITMLRP
ncbi:nitrous oxide reductase accessory protein NosL [uncultured Shewanella sp.]|uniref:nitrous oxide reductase accessory protein NosL n=1 Tax=uncultured Shewanella sp. TaxID=173975 RepID=UPI0026024C4D|nr:nitrous oxide reductase accessory protein NosL [uncultured Shewanella sp.]